MSHEEHEVESAKEHEGPIKTPRQLLITVILAFLIPIVVIMMLVNLVGAGIQTGAGSDSQTPESIATRIQPVAGFKLVDANAPKVFQTGQQVYESTCTACHTSGVAGAPKLGDKDAWAPYIKEGYDSLVKNAIHGVGAMPPKGGNASLDDFEVARAVVYIANQSGANFDEPAEPAGDTAAGTETPAATVAAAPATPAGGAAAAAPQTAPAAPAPAAESAPVPAAVAQAGKTHPEGEKVYKTVCFSCHDTGIAGAPKFADKDAWAPYIKTGMDQMLKNAIHGVGAMPPRGGSQATDEEIRAAIEYMLAAAAPEAAAAAPAESSQAPAATADAGATLPDGEKVYKSVCFACHDTGIAGAPKFADKAAWAPYIETGMDEMLKNAIHGVGAMPPRGGSQATDEEIRAAIEYMVSAAQ